MVDQQSVLPNHKYSNHPRREPNKRVTTTSKDNYITLRTFSYLYLQAVNFHNQKNQHIKNMPSMKNEHFHIQSNKIIPNSLIITSEKWESICN